MIFRGKEMEEKNKDKRAPLIDFQRSTKLVAIFLLVLRKKEKRKKKFSSENWISQFKYARSISTHTLMG
jgi:hypothetical protein